VAVTLTAEGGRLFVILPGRKGRLWRYAVTRLGCEPEDVALRLEKQPDEGEADLARDVYLVRRTGGHWACNCRDFAFRRRPRGEVCKHISACEGLRPILDLFGGTTP
jgi:hypothetical protein